MDVALTLSPYMMAADKLALCRYTGVDGCSNLNIIETLVQYLFFQYLFLGLYSYRI